MPGSIDPWQAALALVIAFVAGAVNAVAGGGTNLSFPVLVWLGIPAVQANATNAFGLWPASSGAVWGYRREIRASGARWFWLLVPCLLGGAAGAYLLVRLPPSFFRGLAPYLVIASSGLVALEPILSRRVGRTAHGRRGGAWIGVAVVSLFAVSLYGGYFGAGTGLMLLVILGLLGLENLQHANALKNLFAAAMKGTAIIYFVVRGTLVWPVAIVMALGALAGGYAAAHAARRVDADRLRWVVVGLGVAMGIVMVFTTVAGG